MPPKKSARISAGQPSQEEIPQEANPDYLERSLSAADDDNNDEAAQPATVEQRIIDLTQQLYDLQQQQSIQAQLQPSIETSEAAEARNRPTPPRANGPDPRRIPRLDHLEKLDNPKADAGPEFDAWLVNVNGLLLDYGTVFPSDGAQARWLYKQTTGDAQSRLTPYFLPSSIVKLDTAQAVFDHFELAYGDPEKQAKAYALYVDESHDAGQSFNDFFTKFQLNAGIAQISPDVLFRDLKHKLNPRCTRSALNSSTRLKSWMKDEPRKR
ncbi:hypothetical protein HYALB_00014086 [Hymenoscyphus albidus]|uniref:Uncharacterized protein n=1 Tax=Hymenoscyphus albidus TaxID=595503 RepID=A0A9N9LLI2_9HELO|nr:hypothetical protein HYALB_00014086 [Hymenoscyphus albidus]